MKDSTTDRELLELAAKAAGLAVDPNTMTAAVWTVRDASGNLLNWNPLTDDGDALRLAVKLGLEITPGKHVGDGTSVTPVRHSTAGCTAFRDDPMEKTRYAVTRAAAEIGRSHHAG